MGSVLCSLKAQKGLDNNDPHNQQSASNFECFTRGERAPSMHHRDLGGPQSLSGCSGRKKNLIPARNGSLIIQHTASHSTE